MKRFMVILLVFLTMPLVAQRLHVLLAGDDADSVLGRSTRQDLGNMEEAVQTIADKTGLELRINRISGRGYTASNLQNALASIDPRSQDVVLVYLSGGGMIGPDDWPKVVFHSGPTWELPAIYQYAKDLGGRLTLVLGEVSQRENDAAQRSSAGSRTLSNGLLESYERLFLRSRGSLLAAATSPGEMAASFLSGSVFTTVFMESLVEGLHSSSSTWESILVDTMELVVRDTRDAQYPQAYVNVLVDPNRPNADPNRPNPPVDPQPDEPRPIQPEPEPIPSDGYYTNRGVSPYIFSSEFGTYFQYGDQQWILVSSYQSPEFFQEIGNRSDYIQLRRDDGDVFGLPMPQRGGGEVKQRSGNRWAFWAFGRWKEAVVDIQL